MISKFALHGYIKEIHPKSSRPEGDHIVMTLSSDDALFHVVALGKTATLVETALKVGDLIYVEGKLRRDRTLLTNVPKNVIVLFATLISVLP